eukprot:TRINITY_DN28130_c0_g1_i1.p1 TRINITY_DN28130_c0_g1~~TRINITY_DN28130_c0_g1_i1.p1  ORF type:complete len:109 (-),score=2.95 TRINITY_DN28130_c0_g1_i1:27-353(-)
MWTYPKTFQTVPVIPFIAKKQPQKYLLSKKLQLNCTINQNTSQFVNQLSHEKLWVIETNLDDLQPQVLAYTQNLLLEKGALDVWVIPIVMKKSRSGRFDVREFCEMRK